MSDTTHHYRCTKCRLPCETFPVNIPADEIETDPPKRLSLCCRALVDVVAAKS